MSTAYLAEIRIFCGQPEPDEWLLCNGQVAQVEDFQALFLLIGAVYGGDGVDTFAVPTLPDPAPGCHYMICCAGVFPSEPGGAAGPGVTSEVTVFAGWLQPYAEGGVTFVPAGWLHCDGSTLPLPATGPSGDLFSLIQTKFGGDGRTGFALPRLNDLALGVQYIICVEGTVPARAS